MLIADVWGMCNLHDQSLLMLFVSYKSPDAASCAHAVSAHRFC